MHRSSPRQKHTSRLTALSALVTATVLLVPGTASAEMGQVHTESQEVIITDEGVFEVGEDVESLDAFLEENPEYAPAIEDPDRVGARATESLPITHGTLTTRTTGCNSATVTYKKTTGTRLTIRFSVAQLGSLTRNGPTLNINAGQTRSFTANLSPIGNVQGRMKVDEQNKTFVNKYISCR
ncbi:hypothetical protein [Nocardiopsis sp. B62]|uniref:hypothetical protein n=1 Tax=Nocardiopsis sp. B62 TaxID=2824874 RepID=UPI001B366009|nr:hypothetical protein [Nocardiopsis sp. B62]MBQ1081160.1 hypothetical protein [Nocardiopsis sp. B62]